ncbi:MAG: SIMPL domain-containing protein [Rikenellaceae bacterium]|nr:SIMPL domain-containing protein [Rikenellaceae bacterium]
MKQNNGWALILGVCLVIAAAIGGSAYKYKYKAQNTVTVTGLGEKEFVSDLIVWRGWIVEQSDNVISGYAKLEANRQKVADYIKAKGIADSCVVFMFVNVNQTSEPIYSNGQYVGSRQTGYELRQQFRVESTDVAAVEDISRQISSLIAQGVQLESWEPEYYYTKLSDLKLELIENATADALSRAEKIVDKADASIIGLKSARMGVIQIMGANSNEAQSAGGVYNTASKNKKASITMRLEYNVK